MKKDASPISRDTRGRERVIIESVSPAVDNGMYPAKRVTGDVIEISADIFADGHDELAAVVKYRKPRASRWQELPMSLLVNDRWTASFLAEKIGVYRFTIEAWVDPYKSWASKLKKRVTAKQDTTVALQMGANLLEEASTRATGADAAALLATASILRLEGHERRKAEDVALHEDIVALASKYADHSHAAHSSQVYEISVDRQLAEFSSWYEMFPRSCSPTPGQHGTFKDCEARLPYVAELGFDILYLPPIHPIGVTARKGRNNAVACRKGDPGTPWAIGSSYGGHKAVNPLLGTLDDFRSLAASARDYGIGLAMDIALQCSPDHPYVTQHPQWFRWRPDGTIQYAENPPKKYQDIYPLEFDNDDWEAMWLELRSIFEFWIESGVRIFRVDNPHTKPYAFWEWLIRTLMEKNPDLIFLAEAFTRPKVMYRLAKLGFTQSYTYFTWRRTKWELTQYLTELTTSEAKEFFRPNFWPNTPDILMDYLQEGGRPAFQSRLVLAATLSGNYGIYGPAFELCVNVPREKGSEEYLNSEKYELKRWNLDDPASIKSLVTRMNSIRREHPALQRTQGLSFQHIDNDLLVAYSKHDFATKDLILTIVNIDPQYSQSGWIDLDFGEGVIDHDTVFHVHDLLSGATYEWRGPRNYVALDPTVMPAHVFEVALPATVLASPGNDAGERRIQ